MPVSYFAMLDARGAIVTISSAPTPGAIVVTVDDPRYIAWLNTPPSPPTIISHRQFFQALAMRGLVTEDEALAAMQGIIPARMDQFISTLTPQEQFTARMIIKGAGEFDREHPLTEKFAAFEHMNEQQISELWALAASL